ncbi:NADP-dependent glyceraldehyde-3-phosphate dehydrogenase [Clostridium pasteurianum DSM 525 = ATCC 6013]|uniref:Glyceraldehyde-3-phosphate dehydrogenase (NADP(+)) n=1 Tax=Clostridium pasteurianum DSM 525 = ATCC 6013 TaxID=1262449 RepID=A0A0H3J8S7_CLOPA|nr:NADP-dependent glyceraldehyde-3-phosphate dehydrogenase [Clostridium pasteurianum]AJA47490.1 NADP-dependent glyceraldehyde-3-phosphate dehydrogenase [Clostridium pasteurianum DSM 525 = ATCC 6013]AJA51478.1 NADP-dependent glyceraldehyde-3-phosphate dehydrogenase [Clostridium pasteurianum DSM 525 = ATCC 6013]AOZ74809.1 glyceraldehyde-3-phosphate dehydrogenase [Clostridium pasteurianum DSM 525 = ATCC 6013]AOZ78605.1 glyceraldehyde-3-phosphate dehydrogenase [Clostridium pasteurianum]ELP57674.1 
MFENISNGKNYKSLFNGEWIESKNKNTIELKSPVDESIIGSIQALSKEEVDEVLEISREAQIKWGETPISERAEILYKAADILEENVEEIAKIMQLEIAKDSKSAISEVKRTVDFIRFTASEGKHIEGETIGGDNFPGFNKSKLSFVTRVPLGVVLSISPFNYPVNLSASKIAPALVAGNSVVLKPPTQGAISALYLAEVFNKAGIPKGVLNTVTGRGSEIGDYLVTHKNVNFINFTGSTEVGKHIAKEANMIPMMMELGGKDAAIVLEDADLELAAKNIVSGAYSYSGQRCTAVKRVLVLDTVADKLVSLLEEKVKKLKVGNPKDEVDITPLIDSKAADFVQGLIDDAIDKGAKLLVGNKREGNLIYPTLFDNVTTDMRLAWEEPFGPVLPIIRIKNIEEAIDIANKSEYGLQSSVFTQNIDDAFYIAKKLEVGTVQINNKTERGPDHFPFLGVKSSGMGTQGIRYSIEAMSRPKAIVLNLLK